MTTQEENKLWDENTKELSALMIAIGGFEGGVYTKLIKMDQKLDDYTHATNNRLEFLEKMIGNR